MRLASGSPTLLMRRERGCVSSNRDSDPRRPPPPSDGGGLSSDRLSSAAREGRARSSAVKETRRVAGGTEREPGKPAEAVDAAESVREWPRGRGPRVGEGEGARCRGEVGEGAR